LFSAKIIEIDGETELSFSDPLEWWMKREVKYPYLSMLASRVLCIPATSAPSERLFSTAGLTIANDRSRILPEHAESVIFLKCNQHILNM
jgi:hypothetical protein